MRSTRQAILVSSVYGSTAVTPPARKSRPNTASVRPNAKSLADRNKPRPAAVSFNFAHRQYTTPVHSNPNAHSFKTHHS